MPLSGGGAIVRLTAAGVPRVLHGMAGMVFQVDTFSQAEPNGQLMAHVRDHRFTHQNRPYQVWSLGEGQYEILVERSKGSGCECCDHRLQHIIRDALNTYQMAVPPLRVGAVMETMREQLDDWEADQ